MSQEHSERPHSQLGGSTANRWINCPGSVGLCAQVLPTPPSEAALEGTLAHQICQIVLEDFLEHKISGSDPRKRIKEIEELLPEKDEDAEEMMEAALGFRDAVWSKLLNSSITSKVYGIEEEFVFEEAIKSYGFIDFWAVYIDDKAKRVGVISDFKYGNFPVDAKDNDQLLYYACAVLAEIRRGGKDLDYMILSIFQPRNRYKPENYEPFKSIKVTVKQLDAWRKKAMDAAHIIFITKKPKFKIGKWCHFCSGKSLCKKYTEEISKSTALKLLDLDNEEFTPPEGLTDEKISKMIAFEDQLIGLLKSCKKYALGKCLNGGIFPGFKAVEKKGRKKWSNKDGVIEALTPILGIENVCNFKPKGIGDLTKAAKGNADATKKLLSYVITGESSAILVPSSDERPALSSALDKLSCVEEEDN